MAMSKVSAVVIGCAGVFFISILSCGGLLFYLFRNAAAAASPRIDALFAEAQNNTFGDTYLSDTTPEFRAVTTKKQYEDLGATIRTRLGALNSKNITSFYTRQLNSNTFIDVGYNATFEKGSGTITARLQNVNGKWLFASFRVNSPVLQTPAAIVKCLKCGEPLSANAKFCAACGAPVPAEEDQNPSASVSETN